MLSGRLFGPGEMFCPQILSFSTPFTWKEGVWENPAKLILNTSVTAMTADINMNIITLEEQKQKGLNINIWPISVNSQVVCFAILDKLIDKEL